MARLFKAALFALAVASAAAGSIHWEDDVLVIDGQKTFDMAVKQHAFMVVEFYAPVRGPRHTQCTVHHPTLCACASPRRFWSAALAAKPHRRTTGARRARRRLCASLSRSPVAATGRIVPWPSHPPSSVVRPLQVAGSRVRQGCQVPEGARRAAPAARRAPPARPEAHPNAAAAQDANSTAVLAKVDATLGSNKALAEKFGVKGYPTLKIIRNHDADAPAEYGGPREAAGIVSYVQKLSGPAVTELTSAEDVTAFAAKDSVVVVGVFPSGVPQFFSATAEALRDSFSFGYVADAALVEGGEATAGDHVLLFRSFDEPKLTSAAASAEELTAFIMAHSLPLLTKLDQEPANRAILQRVFEFQAPKAVAFVAYDGQEEPFVTAVSAAAKKHAGIKFLIGDPTTNEGALNYFGLKPADMPAIVIHDNVGADKKYTKPLVAPGEIEAWLAAFEAGELSATVKSEEVPEENDGPVTTLVGKNFEAIVQPGKTILLEFYAPWCGHCKKLAPIYEEVGAHFAKNEGVVIAKMDSTANDVADPRFAVKGFPTLFLQTAAGEVVPYSGDRSKADLIKFVTEHLGAVKDVKTPSGAAAVPPEPAPEPAAAHEAAHDEL